MHALFGIGWTQHWGIQGSCDRDICATFYPLLEVTSLRKHACVKDSSAEGTCDNINKYTYTSFYLENIYLFIIDRNLICINRCISGEL